MNAVASYPVDAVLGRGRSSVVYLAHEPRTGRQLALKVARRADLVRQGREADFSHEFTALRTLAHRHVIQVTDHGVQGDNAFLVMEVADGGPLPIPATALEPARVHALMTQAASALAELHRLGWVHRDLKPANLLQRTDGSLALADFGCACRAGESGPLPAGAVTGTPQYAAPEQIEGRAAHPAADVYSLGILLHQLLTGRVPYPGETVTELLGQHLLAPVPRLPRERSGWQPLLDSMLAKAPCERLRDGAAVLQALQRLQKDLP